MSNIQPATQSEIIEQVVIEGDLSKLNPEQRTQYYNRVCQSLDLNPLTKPFAYIRLNGALQLYARKDATEQLRAKRKVSVIIVSREKIEDVYIVTARAKLPDGREDESTGAVAVAGLKGENLANAYMKAETKAKRRVTLSVCGLGFLDETEVDSIAGAQRLDVDQVNQPDPKVLQLNKALAGPHTGSGEKPFIEPKTQSREELTKELMALYRPFMAQFPETQFAPLLSERYSVAETKLMTVEQLIDLIDYMKEQMAVVK